jgi:hypothetical protein
MVTTQDVSFGTLWVKLIGKTARWTPGDDRLPAFSTGDGAIGMGLVAVWVGDSGPVLICRPNVGMKILKSLSPGLSFADASAALRDGGAVIREDPHPPRETEL